MTAAREKRFFTVGDLMARWGLSREMVKRITVNMPHFGPPGAKRHLALYSIAAIEQFEAKHSKPMFQLAAVRPQGLRVSR